MLKHLALFSFLASSGLTLATALLFFRMYTRTGKKEYHAFGLVFSWATAGLLGIYLAEYLVMNITHADTVPYASLEAFAFSSTVIAVIFFSRGTATSVGGEKSPRAVTTLLILCGVMLVFTRFSNHIFGYHAPALHLVKLISLGILGITVLLESLPVMMRCRGNRPLMVVGLIGLSMPVLISADLVLIRFKLYEGPERLGMSYPLSIILYIILSSLLAIFLTYDIRTFKPASFMDTLSRSFGITPREKEIVHLIYQGYSNADIADTLCISLTTVKNHVHNIFGKMNITSRYELISLLHPDQEK